MKIIRAFSALKFAIGVNCLAILALWVMGRPEMILPVSILTALEISLSFDNAVINAGILRTMTPRWQRAFLTIGIVIAVFGVRFVFPLLAVVATAHLPLTKVMDLALHDPSAYATMLSGAQPQIAAFGGAFLMMIFLTFLGEPAKIVWLRPVRRSLRRLTSNVLVRSSVVLLLLIGVGVYGDTPFRTVMIPGTAGLLLHEAIRLLHAGMGHLKSTPSQSSRRRFTVGLSSFLMLELIDASASFDGLAAAFAVTSNIFVIMLGLGIGALYVRSFTVYLAKTDLLEKFRYINHGAHYALGFLSIVLIGSIIGALPEFFVAGITLSILALAVISSLVSQPNK